MMISELLEELRQKEIEVTFSAGRLKYSGPEENITPALVESLVQNKGKLIKYFWPEELGNLMPINPEGLKAPLFLVHGDNGNYLISSYLGKDQPVYGFFHPGSEGEEIPFSNVKEMAAEYRRKLQLVSPKGPYFLAGFSFGGVIAYEMAIQLRAAGHEVPFLVLIDTFSPLAVEPVFWHSGLYRIMRSNILRPIKLELIRLYRIAVCKGYIYLRKPIPPERRNFYMLDRYRRMTTRYKPQKFDGEILLFRTVSNRSIHKNLGWDALVKGIKLIFLDASHETLFDNKKSAEVLTTEFEKYLFAVREQKF